MMGERVRVCRLRDTLSILSSLFRSVPQDQSVKSIYFSHSHLLWIVTKLVFQLLCPKWPREKQTWEQDYLLLVLKRLYLTLRCTGATLGSGTWRRPWPARKGRTGKTKWGPGKPKGSTSKGGGGPCWQTTHRSTSPRGSLDSDNGRRTRPWLDHAGREAQNISAKVLRYEIIISL